MLRYQNKKSICIDQREKKEPILPISERRSVTLSHFIPIVINWDSGKGDQGDMMRKESEINMRFVRLGKDLPRQLEGGQYLDPTSLKRHQLRGTISFISCTVYFPNRNLRSPLVSSESLLKKNLFFFFLYARSNRGVCARIS